jgi:proteic killer suppression protein
MCHDPLVPEPRSQPFLGKRGPESDPSGLGQRASLVLSTLDATKQPKALDLPGLGFHSLTGRMAGRFSVGVSRNWRITFGWSGEDAVDVDLEDYHGG